MSQKRILFIDEERWSIEPIIDRINSEFGDTVDYIEDGSSGLSLLLQKGDQYQCVILDIMFPLGADLDDGEEDRSVRAGLILLHLIRRIHRIKVPIICFTIRDDDEVKTTIEKFSNATHICKVNMRAMDLLMIQLRKYIR